MPALRVQCFSLSRLCVLYVETLTGVLFWFFDLLGNIFVQFVFHLRPSPDHYYFYFCEFSFGADIIIFTDRPGLPSLSVLQLRRTVPWRPSKRNDRRRWGGMEGRRLPSGDMCHADFGPPQTRKRNYMREAVPHGMHGVQQQVHQPAGGPTLLRKAMRVL